MTQQNKSKFFRKGQSSLLFYLGILCRRKSVYFLNAFEWNYVGHVMVRLSCQVWKIRFLQVSTVPLSLIVENWNNFFKITNLNIWLEQEQHPRPQLQYHPQVSKEREKKRVCTIQAESINTLLIEFWETKAGFGVVLFNQCS